MVRTWLVVAVGLVASACSDDPRARPDGSAGPPVVTQTSEADTAPPAPASDAGVDANSPDTGSSLTTPDAAVDIAPAQPPLDGAFTIVAKLSLPDGGFPMPSVGPPLFASEDRFGVYPQADGRLIVGAAGKGQLVRGRRESSGAWTADESVAIRNPTLDELGCNSYPEYVYKTFSFLPTANGCSGFATGEASALYQGDVVVVVKFTATLSCAPAEAVRIVVPGFATEYEPREAPVYVPSRPLEAGARAQLVDEMGRAVDLEPLYLKDTGLPVAVLAFSPRLRGLWFKEAYSFKAVGTLRDLRGIAVTEIPPLLKTSLAPVVVSQDGFEGTSDVPPAFKVVDGQELPVISGTKSLYLPPSGWTPSYPPAQLRLAVKPTDTVVRAKVRRVRSDTAVVSNDGSLMARGVPVVKFTWPSPVDPTEQRGQLRLTPVTPFEVALPPGAAATGEVLLTFRDPTYYCGFPSPYEGLLIDDLRAE